MTDANAAPGGGSRDQTPCIGVCSTTYSGAVCRGCKRFAHEIIDWNRYSQQQQSLVIDRLESLNRSAVRSFVRIEDVEMLRQRLDGAQICYNAALEPECWLLPLLWSQQVTSIEELAQWGIVVLDTYRDLRLSQLTDMLDSGFFQLSNDYYNMRHFVKGDSPEWE